MGCSPVPTNIFYSLYRCPIMASENGWRVAGPKRNGGLPDKEAGEGRPCGRSPEFRPVVGGRTVVVLACGGHVLPYASTSSWGSSRQSHWWADAGGRGWDSGRASRLRPERMALSFAPQSLWRACGRTAGIHAAVSSGGPSLWCWREVGGRLGCPSCHSRRVSLGGPGARAAGVTSRVAFAPAVGYPPAVIRAAVSSGDSGLWCWREVAFSPCRGGRSRTVALPFRPLVRRRVGIGRGRRRRPMLGALKAGRRATSGPSPLVACRGYRSAVYRSPMCIIVY